MDKRTTQFFLPSKHHQGLEKQKCAAKEGQQVCAPCSPRPSQYCNRARRETGGLSLVAPKHYRSATRATTIMDFFFSPSLLYTLSSFGTSIGGDVIRHDNYPSYFQLTLSTLLRRSQSLSGIRGSTDMGEHGTLIKNHLRFGTWQLTLVPFESLLWRRSSSWYLSIWYMCWNGTRACGCHAEYVKMTIVLAATLFVSLYECSATVPQLLQWTRKTR